MKKLSLLAKLKKQGKLTLVEPSKEVCQSYLEKSSKSLNSAKATLEIESYEDSVAMSYYSMYYNVLALLFCIGVKCENHTAAIILLKRVFDIDNNTIKKAKTERIDKQYYVDFVVTKEEVIKMIETAEQFNAEQFSFIDTLNKNKIDKYKNKAKEIIKENI